MRIPPLALLQAAVLAAAILAGCATPPDTLPAPPAPGQEGPTGFLLGDITLVAQNPNNQVEAAITVSPDGRTILTCFHGFFSSLSPGYASTDGGATWTRMAFPDEAGFGGDCETALLDDGSWAYLASTVAGATVLVSRDNGTTWTFNPLAAIPTNGLADRPWLLGVGNELWLAYMPLNFQPGTVGFTKSTDHGATWSTPVHVGMPGPSTLSVRHGTMVRHGSDGGNGADGGNASAVSIPMVRAEPSGMQGRTVQVATTTDGGATWTVEDIWSGTAIVSDWPSMAVTASGDRLVVVTGADGNLHGLHKAPGGEWSDPFLIHEAKGGRVSWPYVDGGAGRTATFVTEGAAVNRTANVWLGRIDLADRSVTAWPLGEAGIEFGSVDHDAAGNAYAVWTRSDGQRFVKATLAAHAP